MSTEGLGWHSASGAGVAALSTALPSAGRVNFFCFCLIIHLFLGREGETRLIYLQEAASPFSFCSRLVPVSLWDNV